ncbi:MAG: MBL fold metallo-hydrolase [Gammaproteobacteria bacterium]|nr:MBL fold metallo-hydrolase [Gammaproteobacteria bacterium]
MLIRKILLTALLGITALCTGCSDGQTPDEEPVRGIVQITGDLYRAQDGFHFTVYLVTPDGIILADPLNADFAGWLRAELERRHGLPVRYVLYSHHHWDHAAGADVFDDTATLIGHENFPTALAWGIENFPVQVTITDTNGDGGLDRSEAVGDAAAAFDELDMNGNDFISGAEILADVVRPEVLYSDHMTIRLGGKTVELIHPGPSHSIDTTVLLFPEERTIYGVDFLNVKRLALGFPGTGTLDQWIASLQQVEALDFDIVSPGHSSVGTKADFTAYREFFEDLREAVNAAIAAGTSLEDLLASDALAEYSDLPNYVPQRDRNIEDAYNLLR